MSNLPLTFAERIKAGRAARKHVSRADLGKLHQHPRAFDPIAVLKKSAVDRVPKLLPVKYARMAVSPFAFFRGAVAIMAADLASTPNTTIFAQLCGDAHVQNMGSFETPDGRIVFDLNDFDETIEGPWEWDVKRMAASIVLAGFESNHAKSACSDAVQQFASSYCRLIAELSELPVLEAARYQILIPPKAAAVSAAFKQAERASPLDLLAKYTAPNDKKEPRFQHVEHVVWPVQASTRDAVLESIPVYKESLAPERLHLFDFFRPVDVAFKIVGTGSVGLRDYIVLFEGNGKCDPLFLQFKQETHSAYALCLKNTSYAHQGRRVAEGQRKVQPLSDLLIGWSRIGNHDYLVRQLNDHKGSIDLDNLRDDGLDSLASIAGKLLARGHARSGDAAMIRGYIGKQARVVESVVQFAMDYAAQTQMDFELFHKAIKKGTIRTAQ